MSRIFINYRRSLSYHAAARLRDLLAAHFGPIAIFLDDHAFEVGASFPDRIRAGLNKCEVFLSLIDVGWADTNANGRSRIHNPEDWVRREIEAALGRNRGREPTSEGSVLIIPVLLNGVGMPKPADLPPSIADITNHFGISFRNERDVEALIPIIEATLGDPLVGNLGSRLITSSPDASKSNVYRFRAPISKAQLEPFVSISDSEPDISLANPGLEASERLGLYDNWCQWTARDGAASWWRDGNSSCSFLILEHLQESGEWKAMAISILLPLSKEGGTLLTGMTVEALNDPAGKRTAVTFEADHLQPSDSACILIDTWAVGCLSDRIGGKRRRLNHHNWGVALLLRHVAEFWLPEGGKPITIMAEPNERVGRMLSNLGFERRMRNVASGDLYYLDYPLNPYRYGPEITATVEKVMRNISKISKVPVVRE